MTDWEPIETAPNNGEAFLAYSPVYNGVLICAINGGVHSWWTPGLGHLPMDSYLFPTHWMPLPAPPEKEYD